MLTPLALSRFGSPCRRSLRALSVSCSKYRGATVVKPNLHEAERCAKMEITGEAALHEAAARLVELLGESALLVTRGPDGMSLFRPGRSRCTCWRWCATSST